MKLKIFRLIKKLLKPIVFVVLAFESEIVVMRARLRKEFKNNAN